MRQYANDNFFDASAESVCMDFIDFIILVNKKKDSAAESFCLSLPNLSKNKNNDVQSLHPNQMSISKLQNIWYLPLRYLFVHLTHPIWHYIPFLSVLRYLLASMKQIVPVFSDLTLHKECPEILPIPYD